MKTSGVVCAGFAPTSVSREAYCPYILDEQTINSFVIPKEDIDDENKS